MKKILKRNQVILYIFSFLWLLAFGLSFFLRKGELMILISEYHSDNLNLFFKIMTSLAEEPTFILLVILYLFIRFKNSIAIASIGILCTIIAFGLKAIFAQERPYLYFKNSGQENLYKSIEGIEPYMGLTSFPSGHTMAGFALMTLLILYKRNLLAQIIFLLLAILVGLSRIYLGHHFLEDVLAGSIIGLSLGLIVFYLIEKWHTPKLEASLLRKKELKT